ncbi:terpene synthase family protein [Streptosporangium sp. NBC_01756]|uniref:terpene synthase family protein n=1 Tax=Streptosporangium sp. NBC_01756 TaxID=2975950 RepID=UPI002DD8F9A9|nr:terpene synthase family protein [Streptosporangium sp. NBC_01756]WSC84847.1 terpene synthase family protein [Streptosporangium sp. NBC_01756]
MRTEHDRPPNGATPHISFSERLAAMTVPCPAHPSTYQIEAAVIDWSREAGLGAAPGVGAHLLAGRVFARYGTGPATLFARWLTWASHLRESPSAFAGVIAVAAGGEPGAPLERAFADLWRTPTPGAGDGWRERFLTGLAAQHAALLDTRTPPVGDYPALGRAGFGSYLFDLVEPCTGVEVPAPVRESAPWRAVAEASGDVAAWCHDLVAGSGYLTSASVSLGLHGAAAERWVIDRVTARMEELWTAARTVPPVLERHGLGFTASREVTQVVCAFLTIPRAYLEWLLESSRYRHLR